MCGLHKHNPLVWCMRVSMVGEAVGAPVCGVGGLVRRGADADLS